MGPFDDISRGQLNVDEAVASGIAATQPVATTTTGEAPVIPQAEEPTGGFQSNLQVESPQWAGLPSQQDFGQVDVRRGNYNTGMVPTVNVQMPFAALANRQQALAQRKAAIDKQVADFDLYSKVGSPDARYAQAFNRYATQGMDQWLNDYATSMHGGDRRAAMRDIATNPEAGRMWMNKSKEFQAVAEENKKWMEVAEKRLAQHVSGEATIRDPKALAALSNFVASVDESRTPIGADGKPLDAGSFGTIARQAVPEIQKLQYIDKVIDPLAQGALKTTFGVTSLDEVPRKGGNIVMTTQQKKTYDDYLNMIVSGGDDRFVEDFYEGDKEAALKDLQAVYPTSVEDKAELRGVNYAPVGSGSGRTPPPGAMTVNYAKLPQDIWRNFPDAKNVGGGMDFPYIPIADVVSGQGKTPHPRAFASPDQGGSEKFLIPERLINIGGKLFISGKEAAEPGASKTGGTSMSFTMDDGNIQEFKVLGDKVVPYEGNESRMEGYFPWMSPEAISEKFQGTKPRGGNPQQSKAAQAPAGVAELAKSGGVVFDQKVFDAWPKEKQDAFVAKLKKSTGSGTAAKPPAAATSSATTAKPPAATAAAPKATPTQSTKAPVVPKPVATQMGAKDTAVVQSQLDALNEKLKGSKASARVIVADPDSIAYHKKNGTLDQYFNSLY